MAYSLQLMIPQRHPLPHSETLVLALAVVEQFESLGQKFDPNVHDAVYQIPDATREPGIVAHVTKEGYHINDRILRPAQCGITRAP